MMKLIGLIISILLILIIFIQIPQENIGLGGSPSSAQRFLNRLTAIGILIYIGIAIKLNLSNN